MPSVITVFGIVLSRVRSFHSLFYDVRCTGGVGMVDQQPEENNVPVQPEKKRRKKVQKSLCVNSMYIERIADWLRSDAITTIGIHGMGGVGKTTLALHLYDQLRDGEISSTNFNTVGWVTVEMGFTVYQLQEKIAATFGIDLEGDKDENRRAAMLYAFLSRTDKECILFLDGLWDDFRREDVGIPRNCKLIVVSRVLDVCRVLRCQRIIKVEPLSEEESWQLFQHSIGGYSDLYSELVSSVRKVVYDESAGLPLAITELANSMMVVDASRRRELSIGPTQMDDIHNQLKLSYDRLNNDKLQRCFLHFALNLKGDTIGKDELIRNWIEEKLIDDVPEAQYDMGHTILNKLLNSCLLQSSQDGRNITMHQLVRHMALFVAGNCSIVKAEVPKMEFSKLTGTIHSSSTSLSKPVYQPYFGHTTSSC